MSYSIRSPKHPQTWTERLALLGSIRRLAYDRSLASDDAMRRIRDAQDGGTIWTVATTPIPDRITSLSFRDRRSGFAVGGDRLTDVGVVARTSDGGTPGPRGARWLGSGTA